MADALARAKVALDQGRASEAEQIARAVLNRDARNAAAQQLLGGAPLHPTSTATTVRVRDGKTLTTDGPFAETREQLGGYYLVEAKDLDAAVAIAARIPGAKTGSIEVRPIRVYN